MSDFVLHPGGLTLQDLHALTRQEMTVELDGACWEAVEAAYRTVAATAAGGDLVYGINTGFGSLAATRIAADDIGELQVRLIRSHCVGTGPLLGDTEVRLVLALKINALARGHSGVQRRLIEALLALLNAAVYPCVPVKGSGGASGDLAPLAHLSLVLIGEGEVRIEGDIRPAREGLRRAGIDPLALGPKEGLALLNGTQVSTAMALSGLFAAQSVFAAALVAGALSVDAAQGSDIPFAARVQEVRGQPGQITVGGILRRLLEGSEIRASHLTCDRVQDPYSLRCQPQVMGSCLDLMGFAAGVLEREANAVCDNPLVFPESGDILSAGNFHAEPVAQAADILALALTEITALAERRIQLLTNAVMSGLPAFLIPKPGLNSGFMAAQIAAAALASENKALAHPVSIDSLPTTADQEDHVSMATYAARRLAEMAENAATVVAIELLAAAQGVDLRKPLKTSPPLAKARDAVRALSPFLETDRVLAGDIAAVAELVASGWFRDLAPVDDR